LNISQFYHPQLIELYINILKNLNIEFHKENKLESLCSKNLKNSYRLMFDNKQMILADDDWTCITEKIIKSKLIFNPLDEFCSCCSNLALTDAIHSTLTNYIYKIFNIVIEKKLKINIVENDYYTFDTKDINGLPRIDIHTLHKWKNIYNIITATSFSRNLISFSFTYNSGTQSFKIESDYPLYRYLEQIKNNNFFSITLEDSEVKLFKNIYKCFIINIFEDLLNNDIDIPSNSNKCPTFYTLITLFLNIKELLSNEYRLEFVRWSLSFIKKEINDLNKYFYFEHDKEVLKKLEEIKKADNKAYNNELKIRRETNPNWLLLKDNIMAQKQSKVQIKKDIEVLEKFSNEEKHLQDLNNLFKFLSDEKAMQNYKKSLNELISLGKKANNVSRIALQKEYNQRIEKENKLYDIYYWQDVALSIIDMDGICLWQSFDTEDYYFRAGINNKVKSRNKDKTAKKISAALNERLKDFIQNRTNLLFAVEIKIVETVEEAYKITEALNLNNLLIICIFKQEIPVIEDEVFDIQNSNEFFKYYGSLNWTRNLFVHNNHLIKRYTPNNINIKESYSYSSFRLNEKTYLLEKSGLSRNLLKFKQPKFVNYNNKESFIEQFIFYLVNENINTFNYVMNWIAYFFQTLNKTSTALVLLGDKDSSEEYFFKNIIKEIFGSKYCTTICDEEYKKPIVSDIADGKIFYHIANIDNKKTKFDNKTLSQILKQLLLRQSVESKNKDNKYDLIPIYGQTIITSDEAYEITKPCFSKCTVVKVNDLEIIMKKLEIPDEGILESKIQEDLEFFSTILSIYPVNKDFAKYALTTEDRDLNKKEELEIIDENVSLSQVDEFINAFKSNKEDFLKYFEVLRDDEKLLNPLVAAYEKGYFINQYLFDYFSKIYNNHSFANKTLFMNKLKEKDEMFKQESDVIKVINENGEEKNLLEGISSFQEVNYKKLSKINDYKLAKDILVPKGFIITNREGNARFKYEYEDIELAKNMYVKYDKEKQYKKEKEEKSK
jgi:hypothetical protein